MTIANLRGNKEEPWCTMGDFNAIRNQAEKRGGNPVDMNQCSIFENWIDTCKFCELYISGGNLTWSNRRTGEDCIQEKLDRCFFNTGWNDVFPFAQGLALPAIQSDHNPIIVRLVDGGIKRRPTFKFESK
ncbi:hypothetical protein V6N11_010321 [Hibiscus sabdariffa]|uniref:Uncharacterized protein n=2 Tax=Hibiscus sabdariffa TaxID=183260 RepID=A0ABR2E773_9ROSI